MNLTTQSLYSIAGILSIALCVLSLAFARMQPGAKLARAWALTQLMLCIGFIGAGMGTSLPRWSTVIVTNLLMLASGVVFNDGILRLASPKKRRLRILNWGVLVVAAPLFGYWGLVEPDGNLRSAVFSFAGAVLGALGAWLLYGTSENIRHNRPLWALTVLFGVMSAVNLGRGVVSIATSNPDQLQRGANPTHWSTVAGFVILITSMTICVFAAEVARMRQQQQSEASGQLGGFAGPKISRSKRVLLWASVVVLSAGILSELGVAYSRFLALERERLIEVTTITNNAMAEHAAQLVGQMDQSLLTLRSYYAQTHSMPQTVKFLESLHIGNVALADHQGRLLIAPDELSHTHSIADGKYFLHHRTNADEGLYISPLEPDHITGKLHFHLSRRINAADGSFAGVASATAYPDAFSKYYQQLTRVQKGVNILAGTGDHRLRGWAPQAAIADWEAPLQSDVWIAMSGRNAGTFDGPLGRTDERGVTVFRKLNNVPLVVFTGFTDDALRDGALLRMHWPLVSALTLLGFMWVLAMLLDIEVRRHEEQDRFMAMLSHELKTPLSVIRMGLSAETLGASMRQRVMRSVDDINAIVDRCLQSDQLRQGRLSADREICAIAEILNELRAACPAPERIVLSVEPMPPVRADRQLLQTVLSNLLDNALKYSTSESDIHIVATEASSGRGSGAGIKGVRIAITNTVNATGLPEPSMVFKKYYRAPQAHGKTGSGLGLYISAGFAKTMGGHLRYLPSSTAATFELWLPL